MDPVLQLHYLRKNSQKYSDLISDFIQENQNINNILAVVWVTEKVKSSLPIFLELPIDISYFSKNLKRFSENEQDFIDFIQEKCILKSMSESSLSDSPKKLKNESLSDETKEIFKLNEMNHVNSGFILRLVVFHQREELGDIFSSIRYIQINADGPLIHYVSPTAHPKTRKDRVDFIKEVKERLGEKYFTKIYRQFKLQFKDYRNNNVGVTILSLVDEDYGGNFKKGHIVSINLLKCEKEEKNEMIGIKV